MRRYIITAPNSNSNNILQYTICAQLWKIKKIVTLCGLKVTNSDKS